MWLDSFASFLGFSTPQLDETLQAAAGGASFWAMVQADAYAASRGLVSPLGSSIYRNWWTLGQFVELAGEALPLAEVTAAAAFADAKVAAARASGRCMPGL